MYDSRLGRWFAVDPLAVKFPNLSPYNYVANSPLLFVDPDGRDIRIYLANGFYTYTPSMKLDNLPKLMQRYIKTLDKIHSTGEGKKVIERLVNSNVNYIVKQLTTVADDLNINDVDFGFGQALDKEILSLIENENYEGADKIMSEVSDATILMFTGSWWNAWGKEDNVYQNLTLVLGHELFHAYEFDKSMCSGASGLLLPSEANSSVVQGEIGAVLFENYLRQTLYKGTEYEDVRLKYSGFLINNAFMQSESGFFSKSYDFTQGLNVQLMNDNSKKASKKYKRNKSKDDEWNEEKEQWDKSPELYNK